MLALACLLVSACGNKLIRGAAPLVYMTEMSLKDDRIMLQLGLRNLNGVDLDVLSIDLVMSAEGKDLLVYQGEVGTKIAANGTETLSLDADGKAGAAQLLISLEQGEVTSIPYLLTGSVTSSEEGSLRFEHEGHIYPLPGKPGHFR
jgi:hypothetical protein